MLLNRHATSLVYSYDLNLLFLVISSPADQKLPILRLDFNCGVKFVNLSCPNLASGIQLMLRA